MAIGRSHIIGLAVLGLVALSACGSDSKSSSATTAAAATAAPGGTAAAAVVTGSIDAADQSGDGKTITVKAVNIAGAKASSRSTRMPPVSPGPVVGHVAIPEGDSTDVVVTLDAPITTGAFWPMLHQDAGTIGTYEFPGADGPVKDSSGVVMKKITVTVP